MAVVRLTEQTSSTQGKTLTMTAPDATDGIEFDNKLTRGILVITNASASPVTATFDVTKTVDGLLIPDRIVSCPANSTVVVGPMSSVYSQADGFVRVKFSAVTSVTCAVLRPIA